jgi:hypothetical protein
MERCLRYIASTLFRVGRLAMHNEPSGCLCHATQVSMGELNKGLMFDRACLHMLWGLTWDFVGSRWVVKARVLLCVSNSASCRMIYEGLLLDGSHKPQLFSALFNESMNVFLICKHKFLSFNCLFHPSFISECQEGYWGVDCQTQCNCNVTNTLSCNHVTGTCECKAGWEGARCTTDIDECTRNTHNCNAVREVCRNTVGSFYCACQTGYVKSGSGNCQGKNILYMYMGNAGNFGGSTNVEQRL